MTAPFADLGPILVIIPTYNERENVERITARVRAAVAELDQSTNQVCAMIASISAALVEQSSTSNDIARRVEQVAVGIERTHAVSTESSQRAEALVSLSHALKDSVQRFRT